MVTLPEMPQYDGYKESGVDWLGGIPEHWSPMRLKNLCKIKNGSTPASSVSKYWDGEIIWVAPTDINDVIYIKDSDRKITKSGYDSCGTNLVPSGSLIVTCRAPIGKVALAGKELCTNQGCKSLIFSSAANNKFIYYMFSVLSEKLNSLGTGTTFMELSSHKLKKLKLAIPTKEEQIIIADFLDNKTAKIDEAIAIKEDQIALLKERKQIIIQKAVTKGLNPNFPMKHSGVEWIGDIPEHWDLLANRALFSERVEPGRDGLPLLSVSIHSGVSSEELTDDENVHGRVKIEDKSKYILVKKGDVAFNMMRAWQGGIGAVSTDGMVSPAYIVAKPKTTVNAEYFEHQYRCPEFIQQMDRFSKGITDFRKRLYWDGFKQLNTVVPPINEQLQIVRFIKAHSEKVDSGIELLNNQIEKLKEYKTTLINSAVTGKIKVA